MSAAKPPQPSETPTGSDPSMEDILSSIRRILTEDEVAPGPSAAEGAANNEVLLLDTTMMIPDNPAPAPAPAAAPTPAAAATAQPDPLADTARIPSRAPAITAAALHEVVRTLAANQALPVRHGGPTIEELVREELRPLLNAWLDRHLEPLLERLVRTEIERVASRAQR